MIDIVINSEGLGLPDSWDEITVADAVRIKCLIDNEGHWVVRYFDDATGGRINSGDTPSDRLEYAEYEVVAQIANGGMENMTGFVEKKSGSADISLTRKHERQNDRDAAIWRFCLEVFGIFSGMPTEKCRRIEPSQIISFVKSHLSPFVRGLMHDPVFRPKGITSFRINGKKYYLPKAGCDMQGNKVPCCNMKVGEFIEATELFMADRIYHASRIVALVCGAEKADCGGGVYVKSGCMDGLLMSVVFEIFVLLTETHRYMKERYPECYSGSAAAGGGHRDGVFHGAQRNENRQAGCELRWRELPLLAGRYVPGEVAAACNMNVYGFMDMISAGIRMGEIL